MTSIKSLENANKKIEILNYAREIAKMVGYVKLSERDVARLCHKMRNDLMFLQAKDEANTRHREPLKPVECL